MAGVDWRAGPLARRYQESSRTKIIYGGRGQLTALFAESGQNGVRVLARHKDLHTICTHSSLAWQRGWLGSGQVVVVVANFPDFSTPPGPSPEDVVHNWPAGPCGPEMAGDQPGARRPTGMDQPRTIFDREAKIYLLV